MDDPFDSSVWSIPPTGSSKTTGFEEPTAVIVTAPAEAPISDDFDDFDDFSAETVATDAASFGDDFGDFGENIEEGEGPAFPQQENEAPRIPVDYDYEPLVLRPFPPREELDRQIHALLDPIYGNIDTGQGLVFTDEPVRQLEGLGQVLVTPECRAVYQSLMEIPPEMTRPINWTRSRIRRQQLIALGVPVNLDEVLPSTNAKVPTLHITTAPPRSSSAPPGRTSTPAPVVSRAGTPLPGGRTPKTGPPALGPAPKLDMEKVDEVLAYSEATLSILPLPAVEAHLANVRAATESTSALLAHLLQSRDVLQQDSETYNRLIAELVGEAQKSKAPQTTSRWGRKKDRTSMAP